MLSLTLNNSIYCKLRHLFDSKGLNKNNNIYFNLKNLRLHNKLLRPIVIYILLFSDLIRIFKWCSFPWLHRVVGPEILFSFALLQNPLPKKKIPKKCILFTIFRCLCLPNVISISMHFFFKGRSQIQHNKDSHSTGYFE